MSELGITRWKFYEMLRLAKRDKRVRCVKSSNVAYWIFDAPAT